MIIDVKMKRKNKNAFTLIELLAIIVILAIIAVITVPIILNIIDNAKIGAVKDSVYGYKDAINKHYIQELQYHNNLQLDGTYTVNDDGALIPTEDNSFKFGENDYDELDVAASGNTPTGGLLVYENNELKSGCIVIDGYQFIYSDGEIVDTEKGNCENIRMKVDEYKAAQPYTYPTKEGKIFAGWYKDMEHTDPYTETTGYAYPKFINEKIATIRWTVPEDFMNNDTTGLRLITSLDNDNYESVTLQLRFKSNGQIVKNGNIEQLYKEIIGFVDENGETYTAEKAFCEDAHLLAAYTITGMPKALYSTKFVAVPIIETLDGTTVYGIEKEIQLIEE